MTYRKGQNREELLTCAAVMVFFIFAIWIFAIIWQWRHTNSMKKGGCEVIDTRVKMRTRQVLLECPDGRREWRYR